MSSTVKKPLTQHFHVLICVLCFFCVSLCAGTSALAASVHTVSDEPGLRNAISGAATGDRIELTNDITIGSALVISDDKALTIAAANGAGVVKIIAASGRHISVTGSIAAELTFDNVSLDGAGTGGGVYVYGAGASLTLNSPEIRSCYNSSNGGGAYVQGTTARSSLTLNNALIQNCRSGAAGAGVFASDGDLVISGGKISGNNAATLGGGIQTMAGGSKLGSILTVDGGKINGNTAVTGDGGGINTYDTVVTIRNSEISGNTADNYGGGIHVKTYALTKNDSALIIENSTIRGNVTRNTGGGIGVESELREFTVKNCLITENQSVSATVSGTNQGGGIYFVGGTLTLSDGWVTGNRAGKGGGGIMVNVGSLILTGTVEVSANVSDILGGGIYGYDNSTVIIEGNAKVIDNRALCNGDHERLYGGGGAIALYATNLIVKDNAVLSGNDAVSYGGAVWTYPDFTPISTVTVSGGAIERNTANYGAGISIGAIEGLTPSLSINGGIISSNTAAKDGGGIYSAGGIVNISGDAVIKNNTADTGDGGGVWSHDLTTLTTDNVTFEGNKAALGYRWTVNPSSDDANIKRASELHEAQIINTTYTATFANAYNNYDVNFTLGEIVLPPLPEEMHIRYIYGYPDMTVRPDINLTRAEAAVIVYRLTDDPGKETPVSSSSGDVTTGAWYYHEVAYIESKGIMSAGTGGLFRPDEAISQSEFLEIISTLGTGGYTITPSEYITRADAIATVNRVTGRKLEISDIIMGVLLYSDITEEHPGYADIYEASNEHSLVRKENGAEIWVWYLE